MEWKKGDKKYEVSWIEYYQYLEGLRQSGITNMFGAAPYLAEAYALSQGEASEVLVSWMENYDALLSDGVIPRYEGGKDE